MLFFLFRLFVELRLNCGVVQFFFIFFFFLGRCSRCAVEFTLNVVCDSAPRLDVTSRDLVATSHDGRIQVVHGEEDDKPGKRNEDEKRTGIMICKLAKGQRLSIKCVARKGVGKVGCESAFFFVYCLFGLYCFLTPFDCSFMPSTAL